MKTIGIVGGGAAGLVAAIVAAREGAQITIIERQNRIGKKILVTGNGRCNLTNTQIEPKYFHTHSKEDLFKPIRHVTKEDTLAFFEALGIEPLIENQKIYPASEQANSVLDVLRMEIEQLGITVLTDEKVTQITSKAEGVRVKSEAGSVWEFDRVIVATGGLAAPQLGCDSTGYELAKSLGHTVVAPYPTLVHILSPTSYCKMMKGTRVKGQVTIYVNNKKKRSEYGEVLFTEDGLSGPPIFQLSRVAAQCQKNKIACKVVLDLFPQETEENLVAKLYDRMGKHPHKSIEELFVGWLHKRLVIPVIKQADVGSPSASSSNLEYDMIVQLAKSIKGLVFDVVGTRDYKFAQATAGGVSIDEINLDTMQSLTNEKVYMVGELLDVDGDCGGYNLQWAWSTGILAGRHAATF